MIDLPLKTPVGAPPPSSKHIKIQAGKSWLQFLERKRKRQNTIDDSEPPSKVRIVSQRQLYYDADDVRESTVSPEAVHLASAIEFGKAKHFDAEFIVKKLVEDPERFGPYLRDALKRIDQERQPKMPVEKCLATYYYKNLSGWYLSIKSFFKS